MPRNRRRGRRSHPRGAARTGPVSQKPGQPVVPSRPVPTDKAPVFVKASPSIKQPVPVNTHLGKDLRNIGVVTVVLVVLVVVLSMVL
jgi:hypothetical protein